VRHTAVVGGCLLGDECRHAPERGVLVRELAQIVGGTFRLGEVAQRSADEQRFALDALARSRRLSPEPRLCVEAARQRSSVARQAPPRVRDDSIEGAEGEPPHRLPLVASTWRIPRT